VGVIKATGTNGEEVDSGSRSPVVKECNSILLKDNSSHQMDIQISEKGGMRRPPTEISMTTPSTIKEVDAYAIRNNHSHVRISYDMVTGEYLYEVIEPRLSAEEDDIRKLLMRALILSLNASPDPDPEYRKHIVNKAVDKLMVEFGLTLQSTSKDHITYYLHRDLIGYGAIDVMVNDPNIEDCSCVGVGIPMHVYHRKYGSIQANICYNDETELDKYIIWLAQKCGKHISVAMPILDATLPDGSRLNATLGRYVTKRGSSFTIRRFNDEPLTPLDLITLNTMSIEMMAYLWISVEYGYSTMVCGGTASGKTTTLNAVLLFIPPQMKIVSIEDTRELNLPHENWIPSVTRDSSGRRSNEINMYDLLTAALRQRPQYLMVGEVRGEEAKVVFQAMATGHASYSTFHAEDVRSMVHRLENEPINLPRALLSSLNLVLLQGQVKVDGKMTRRARTLTEFVGMDSLTGELITNTVFRWNPTDDSFTYSGHSYLYEKVREIHNWSLRDMEDEVRRRMTILEYMIETRVDDYRHVARIVSAYYKNPDSVMDDVRATLDSL